MKKFFRRALTADCACQSVTVSTNCSAAFKAARRALTMIFVVAVLLTAAIVGAEIKMFDGSGRYVMSEYETEDIAKKRAIQKAKEDAQDKAGIYLTSFSKSVNAHLVADEISAVTNNIIDVSDVKIDSKVADADGEPVIIWTATLKAKIDTDGIFDWLKRDGKDRVTIVQQNDSLKDAIAKNDKQVEDLKEQYKRATSQAEKDRIRKQMEQADRDFLANQKFEEGNELYYDDNYEGAIKLYNEAVKLNLNYAEAYCYRGESYYWLDKYKQAIKDYNKAIELKPNYADAYNGRGHCYYMTDKPEQALEDYNEAIKLNPNNPHYYDGRIIILGYGKFKDLEQVKADYDKMIELDPSAYNYSKRAIFHESLDEYYRAIADYTKALELDPKDETNYKWRAKCYGRIDKNKVIQYFTKAIELEPKAIYYFSRAELYERIKNYDVAVQDYNKAIELDLNYAAAYFRRGKCYESLGDEAKAQADFAKAKELGWKG